MLSFSDHLQGKCNGKSGYFPAKYLLKLQKYQKVYQVTCTMNLTEIDGLGGIRLHKDQVSFVLYLKYSGFTSFCSVLNKTSNPTTWKRRNSGIGKTIGYTINHITIACPNRSWGENAPTLRYLYISLVWNMSMKIWALTISPTYLSGMSMKI